MERTDSHMRIDGNVGGAGVSDGDTGIAEIARQVALAQEAGFDGVWSTEISRDPFLPLVLAAQRSPRLEIGTAVAVAFARNPMTIAVLANDLQTYSAGRFHLGLGTQVKPHIQRRFSMPWSAPAQRMREYVLALRAIWRCWQHDEPLDFRGAHYQHTLMTPMFRPGPNPYGPPPVLVAAVGPRMTSVAAEVADGMLVHSFTTARYLREVTVPLLRSVLDSNGRERATFTVCYPGLVVTGADEREFADARAAVRRQVAFYGATPAYRDVLDRHGWGDLHVELHRLSKLGEWDAMTALVDDSVLGAFAVVGEPAAAAKEIHQRFDGLIDRFTLYTPYRISEQVRRELVMALRAGE